MYLPIYLQTMWWYKYPRIKNQDQVITFLEACKNKDGGYGNYCRATSYLENVFYVITTYSLFNRMDKITQDTIQYIMSGKCADGGFGEPGADTSNIFNTFYAVIALKKLDMITCDLRADIVRYLKTLIDGDTIRDDHIEVMNTTSLYWIASIAQCVAYDNAVIQNYIIDFCVKCYNNSKGLYACIPGGVPTIQNTFECLAILKQFSSLDLVDVEHIYHTVVALKRNALFLDNLTNHYTFSSTMWAIESLSVLNRLNQLEQADVLSYAAMAYQSLRSAFDLYCATSIVSCLVYDAGSIKMDFTKVVEESAHAKRISVLPSIFQKLLRSNDSPSQWDAVSFSHKMFYQVKLNFSVNRMIESESTDDNTVLGLVVPITRITSECINKKVINSKRVRLLGVYDSRENLAYSRSEEDIISAYCKNSNFFSYRNITGKCATKDKVYGAISNGCNIFYISGHCVNGKILLLDKEVFIQELISHLVSSHCSIIIFNCCDTYTYIKEYFKSNPQTCENINIICTLNEIEDMQASFFITSFFRYLELCFPISEAVRLAKYELFLRNNGFGDTWLSYILFGNPFTSIDNNIGDDSETVPA